MALQNKFLVFWITLGVAGFYSGGFAQKTYTRACQCEKTINGQCAYTLMLPVGGSENGVCPSSSAGEGSTAELDDALQLLTQNVSDLQVWTGEQAKTLVFLQNSVNDQNMLLAALQAGPPAEGNGSCEQCDALGEIVEQQEALYRTISTAMADQSATVNSMAQAAQESLDSIQTSQEQLLEANSRISDLVRTAQILEDQLIDLQDNYNLCKTRGLVVSGPLQSIPDSNITSSSIFDEKHTPVRVRIFTESDDQASGAWCPREPNEEEWIQFDLGFVRPIYGVVTRGRADYAQWVTSYSMQYAEAAGDDWIDYADVLGDVMIFEGNTDQNTAKTNMLWQPFNAQLVRLIPIASFEGRNKCMRADLVSCLDNS